jgi:predicted Fe-Mo cluster-binding NifX family protein
VKTLTTAGIEVFLGNSGIVKEVLQKYKNGKLTSTNIANTSEYNGLGGRTSSGRGRRMGRQRGLGTGRNRT